MVKLNYGSDLVLREANQHKDYVFAWITIVNVNLKFIPHHSFNSSFLTLLLSNTEK